MKKNISINISGIIFHIEEDGYERLKAYLESINRYFSTFEDSDEIIADIESRIAEIFLTKLREGKQIITAEDVEQLMATMGSIRDFQTVEDPVEDHPYQESEQRTYSQTGSTTSDAGSTSAEYETKRLYRDEKRKILGGVAAGIAHYFRIDPLWVRLLLVILMFDLFFTLSVFSLVFISYLVCWILVPASSTLEEDKKVKRLYRNPDDKVLGGVSSGLAAYFGTDPLVFRIVFILLLVAGLSGFIIYVVLWAIMPQAKTLTEKMQMQGEPVTLSNIEQNIRTSLNVKDGEENALVKIILFPFRLIATVFKGLGSMAGPLLLFLGDLLRILLGVLLFIVGLSFFFIGIILLGIVTGILNPSYYVIASDVNLDIIFNSIPLVPAVALLIFNFILSLLMLIGGLMLITKRSLLNPVIGWTMLALLVVSLLIVGVSIPATVNDFRTSGSVKVTKDFEITDAVTLLELDNNAGGRDEEVLLNIKGYKGDRIRLEQEFESRGRTVTLAEDYANMIRYEAQQEDSVLTFDRRFSYKDDAVYRRQRAYLTLYIPEGHEFIVDYGLNRILDWSNYRFDEMAGKKVVFDENGDIRCLTCEESRENQSLDSVNWTGMGTGVTKSLDNFNEIEADGNLVVKVEYADKYEAVLEGPEGAEPAVRLSVAGRELQVEYDRYEEGAPEASDIRLLIRTPELKSISLRGNTRMRAEGFEGEPMEITLRGNSGLVLDGRFSILQVEMDAESLLEISGSGERLDAEVSGNSRLDGLMFECGHIDLDISGSSKADIYAIDRLEVEAGGGSDVRYKGDPSVNIESNGAATVDKY